MVFGRLRLCLAVALALSAGRHSAADEPTRLLDFEDAARVKPLLKEGFPKSELCAERSSEGKASLKMTFEEYAPGKPQWPMVSVKPEEAPFDRDWSFARYLAFDAYTAMPNGCEILALVSNQDKREWFQAFRIPPGKWAAIHMDLRAVGSKVDVGNIARLCFYMRRPPQATVIWLDNVRLLRPSLDLPDAVRLILVSPGFHDGFFSTNLPRDVRVLAVFDAPREQVGECAVSVSLLDAEGRLLGSRQNVRPESGEREIALPAPALPEGGRIVLRAEVRRGKTVLASMERAITRYHGRADEVTIGEGGVALLNGVPFFPFGMYQSPASEGLRAWRGAT